MADLVQIAPNRLLVPRFLFSSNDFADIAAHLARFIDLPPAHNMAVCATENPELLLIELNVLSESDISGLPDTDMRSPEHTINQQTIEATQALAGALSDFVARAKANYEL
jgi:hypothetical protein